MDWGQILTNGVTPLTALVGLMWLIHSGYLYLRREYLREEKRANLAEAKAAKYEDLILKGRNIIADAASSHEQIVDELIELAQKHGGLSR